MNNLLCVWTVQVGENSEKICPCFKSFRVTPFVFLHISSFLLERNLKHCTALINTVVGNIKHFVVLTGRSNIHEIFIFFRIRGFPKRIVARNRNHSIFSHQMGEYCFNYCIVFWANIPISISEETSGNKKGLGQEQNIILEPTQPTMFVTITTH